MLVTAGLYWFGNQWKKTFPNNPLAQSVALTIIIAGVLFSGVFQLRRYFIAWPNNPTTKAVFTEPEKS